MSASVVIPLALAVRTLASALTIGLPGPCLRLWERYIIFKKTRKWTAPSLELHLALPMRTTKIAMRQKRVGARASIATFRPEHFE